jgi:hypothetical protein
MRYLNNVLYKVAYQRLLQVWSMIFFYKERGKCKNQKPRRRTTSLTVWGICPVDECFKRPPREMHPHIRGEVSPILPAWGGLPIPSTIIPKASRQSCAVEIASTGSSSSIHHTAKTTRQLAGDATEPKPKA